MIIQKEIKDSFGEYNRSLKTLFADVINNQRDVHMSYYDPEVMKQVAKLSKDNNTLLDNMEKYLETLESNTMTLVGTINSLRGWGIYRVKKDKNKERKKTIKKDEGNDFEHKDELNYWPSFVDIFASFFIFLILFSVYYASERFTSEAVKRDLEDLKPLPRE